MLYFITRKGMILKMKKELKKFIAVCLTAVFALSLCSCGGGEESGDTTIIWYMRKPVGDMSHQQMVEDAANEIIEKELGCKIHFEFIDSGSWNEKINVIIQSGEEFDIINDSGINFYENVAKNAYIDIADMIEKYGPDIKAKNDDFVWDAVTVDGKIMAVPSNNFSVPYQSYAFKKDLIDKYNIDYENIKTIEDFDAALDIIHQNEPGIYPVLATANTTIPYPLSTKFIVTSTTGVLFDVDNDKFIPEVEAKYFDDRYRKANEYFVKGYIPKDAATKTETVSEIKSGKYFAFSGRRSAVKTSNLYGFECVESEPMYGLINTSNVAAGLNAISRTSKHPELAVQVLNLIWKDPDLSNLLAYGIENVDYTVVSGEGQEKSVLPKSGNEVKWSIWHNWLGPLWDQWDSSWNSKESLIEMQELNRSAEVAPILGFVPDLSAYKTNIAMINSIFTESIPVLSTGSMPDYDEYVTALKSRYKDAGIDDVVDEINKQYKEWKSKK